MSLPGLKAAHSQYVSLRDHPPDDNAGNNCPICTFGLSETGMYDGDGSSGGNGAAAATAFNSGGSQGLWAELKDCGHVFHGACLAEMSKSTANSFFQVKQVGSSSGTILLTVVPPFQCPQCKKIYGVKEGNQPRNSKMMHRVRNYHLSGYEAFKTIEIRYEVVPGVQTGEHPNPGM